MGKILASHLAKLGHQVSIANSRGPQSLTTVATEIGATSVSVVDAAQAGEIVFIAIPTKAVADLPTYHAASLSLISATTIPSFAMAASMRSTAACSIANGSRSKSGVP